ncbi:MAG TPA: urease accessory protein UreD [Polyangiaceae bacterium]
MSLSFESTPHGTQLARSAHEGPLRIQRVLYPEGSACPHIYLLHPPGGVVGGDRLETRVNLATGAQVLLTTPAAQKLYRSAGAASEIDSVLSLSAGASLDWLPSETLAFPDARARTSTRVELAPDAGFIGWEITCYGMPARAEKFDRGRVASRFELYREGRPLLIEAIELGQGSELLDEAYALRGEPVVATLYAVPPSGSIPSSLVDDTRSALGEPASGLCSVSSLDELLVVRVLGPHVEGVRALLIRAWQLLRPALLARPAVLPRVWAT